MIKKVALTCDHAAYDLKEAVKLHLTQKGIEFIDCGIDSATSSVDYPDMAEKACALVLSKSADAALLLCGTGVGMSIAANKINGIRACCCSDVFSASLSRMHNDTNALCLGARVLGIGLACNIIDAFLSSEFEGERHALRVDKITKLESNQ